MERILRFAGTMERDSSIDTWLKRQPAELGAIARKWFAQFRGCDQTVGMRCQVGQDRKRFGPDRHQFGISPQLLVAHIEAERGKNNERFRRHAALLRLACALVAKTQRKLNAALTLCASH